MQVHHQARGKALLAFMLTLFVVLPSLALDRHDAPDKYKWNFEDLYPTLEAWEQEIGSLQAKVEELTAYKGRLGESPEILAEYMKLQEELSILMERAGSYVGLAQSVSTHDLDIIERQQKLQHIGSQFRESTSWDNVEIVAIPSETMQQWISDTPALKPYAFLLLETQRRQEHFLDERGEELMTKAGPALGTGGMVYNQLVSQDIVYPDVVLSTGDTLAANYSNFSTIALTSNPQDREAMYKGYYWTLRDYQNTLSGAFLGMLRSMDFIAEARGYESTREMRYFGSAKPEEIQDRLLEIARNENGPLLRYHRLRKQVLGLEKYRYQDIVAPLSEVEITVPFDEAYQILYDAVAPLGEDFQKHAKQSYESRWVDVYPADDKYFNAFCGGAYGVHPYVFINYGDNLESMTTYAHEMGHAVHFTLSTTNQNYFNAGADAIVNETASTMYENFVCDELLKRYKTPEERIAVLQLMIDDLATLFYRQSILGDFELKAHRAQAEGQPISARTLNGFFVESLTAVYGDALDDPEWADIFWASKPHFYSPYYVTDYTFSKVASVALYQQLTTGKKKDRAAATERYVALLKSGGSDFPIDQLKRAGVDLTSPDPYMALVQRMDDLVTQLEKELKKAGRI